MAKRPIGMLRPRVIATVRLSESESESKVDGTGVFVFLFGEEVGVADVAKVFEGLGPCDG